VEKVKYKPEHVLQAAIGFNEDDLGANKQGKLSDGQIDCMIGSQKRSTLAIVLAVLGLGLSCFMWNLWRVYHNGYWFYGAVIGIVGCMAVLSFSSRNRDDLRHDLKASRVEMREGPIRLDMERVGRDSVIWKLMIGDQEFEVSSVVFLAFKNDDPYRVYYLPHSRRLLSAEWLRDLPLETGDGKAEVQA
jgi:hypothetical protein